MEPTTLNSSQVTSPSGDSTHCHLTSQSCLCSNHHSIGAHVNSYGQSPGHYRYPTCNLIRKSMGKGLEEIIVVLTFATKCHFQSVWPDAALRRDWFVLETSGAIGHTEGGAPAVIFYLLRVTNTFMETFRPVFRYLGLWVQSTFLNHAKSHYILRDPKATDHWSAVRPWGRFTNCLITLCRKY